MALWRLIYEHEDNFRCVLIEKAASLICARPKRTWPTGSMTDTTCNGAGAREKF